MSGNAQRNIICALAAIFLVLSYIGIGFGIVSGSPTPTQLVASATIDDSSSPFSKDQLVDGAVATQEYSFSTHDLDEYMAVILEMNVAANTPYADYTQNELLNAPDQYSITNDEISHLNDVYDVSERFFYPIIAIAFIAAFLLLVGYRNFGLGLLAKSFLWSGIATLVLIVVSLVLAIVSFTGLFAAFHSLFFADGSWTFPADSLLITMLPQDFWVGIGAVWIGISAVLSIASLVAGLVLNRYVGHNH